MMEVCIDWTGRLDLTGSQLGPALLFSIFPLLFYSFILKKVAMVRWLVVLMSGDNEDRDECS